MTTAELRALVDAATPGPWEAARGKRPGVITHAEYDIFERPMLIDKPTTFEDARLIALAPELALLAADMADAMYRLDHSDDECRGECLVERRLIYEDFRPLVSRFAALSSLSGTGTQPTKGDT